MPQKTSGGALAPRRFSIAVPQSCLCSRALTPPANHRETEHSGAKQRQGCRFGCANNHAVVTVADDPATAEDGRCSAGALEDFSDLVEGREAGEDVVGLVAVDRLEPRNSREPSRCG